MKDFIALAACKGTAPVRFSRPVQPRPHLVNRLLRDRRALRTICAPDGFGKTALASEYAETMFNYEGVFWLDGASPCFVRDVDDGHLAEKILAVDKEAKLVVVDRLPRLQGGRAEKLLRALRTLLSAGCEVLLLCTPAVGARLAPGFGTPVFGPRDLLLDDSEFAAYCEANMHRTANDLRGRILRVPALAWGAADSPEPRMLESFAAEGLAARELGVALAALLLGGGSRESLAAVAPGLEKGEAAAVLDNLAIRYPFFAIDEDDDSFATPEFKPKGVMQAFRGRLDEAARALGLDVGNALPERVASLLLAEGAGERAADVAACLTQAPLRVSWLVRHQTELMENLLFMPACHVHETIGTALARNPLANRLRLGQAFRLARMGCADAAFAELRPVENGASADDMRLAAMLIRAHFGPEEKRGKAWGAVRDALASYPRGEVRSGIYRLAKMLAAPAEPAAERLREQVRYWVSWYRKDMANGSGMWPAGVETGSGDLHGEEFLAREHGYAEALTLLFGAWVLARAAADAGPSLFADTPEGAAEARAELLPVREYLAESLAARGESAFAFDGSLTYTAYVAVGALQFLGEAGLPYAALPSAQMAAFRRTEARLDSLRREAAELYGTSSLRSGGPVLTYRPRAASSGSGIPPYGRAFVPGPGLAGGSEPLRPLFGEDGEGMAPKLYVRLLGSCEAWVGDRPIDTREFARRKVKVLLAIMVLNAGQELSREQLITELWPGSYTDVAARSFYSVWGKLKRTLSAPGGDCPYLIRMQDAYCMESRLVRSDVARAKELARIFLLGRVDAARWLELLDEFEELYRGELLPSETDSSMIGAFRMQFRRRAIDALIGASARLLAQGENDAALLFAYAAFQRERQREDVYLALMRAQLACDQRTNAVDTYFACREMLAEGLGLDPSRSMMDLYLSIINDDAAAARAM